MIKDPGVTCIGTDGLSMGPVEGGIPVHLAGLPPRGAWFMFLPLRLAGGTGAPGRALAVLP